MSILIFGLQTCAGVVVLGLLGAGVLVAVIYIGGAQDQDEAGVISHD